MTIPLAEIEKEPAELLTLPLLSVPEPLNVPSWATVNVPLSHQGALGPETKLLKFHVPVKSTDCPCATVGNRGSRQITNMKPNNPFRCFERFPVRISDHSPQTANKVRR